MMKPSYSIKILPILFINVLAQDEDKKPNIYLDTPEDRRDFYLVVGVTIAFIVLAWVGCFFVFYRIYKQWILDRKRLIMIYRLPFYIACTDFFINANFFVNIIHTAIHARIWKDPVCNILSVSTFTSLTVNLSLYGVIAMMTYLRICHGLFFHYGKYDYKLWSSVFILVIICQLINLPNHGGRKYWCAGRTGDINAPIILFSIILLVFLVIIFCYSNIFRTIANIQKSALSLNDFNENEVGSTILRNRSDVERRVAKKMISYLLVFMIQWTPMLVGLAGRFDSEDPTWTFVVQSTGRAMGGVCNAVQYVINEGFVPRETMEYDNPEETTNDNDHYELSNNNNNDANSK